MKKITLLSTSLIFIALRLFATASFAQSTASYNITFSSTWENETVDPINGNSTAPIPGNAHWSDLVGATHNENYKMVEMGALASLGIKNVAESGVNGPLMSEVNSDPNANQWLQQGFSPFAAVSSATLGNVVVSSDFSLLSLVSMIAPSPDWMIAINSINLRNGNTWRNEIIIPLFPYDAGTDSGTMYSSANVLTSPFQPISALINQGPFNDKPIGTMTITLNQVLSIDAQNFTEVSLYPNPSSGIINISMSTANPLKEATVYDVLGKQVARIEHDSSDNTASLDLRRLKKGIYLVRMVLKDGALSTKKVVIN